MGEMPASREVQSHKRVAGLHQRHKNFGVGGSAGMRLHIGEAAPEQPCCALDRQPLGNVDELAAAVIAFSRQALGVFIGEHGALRLKHGAADDILRCDQFDIVALAAEFELYRLGNFRIAFAERGGEEILVGRLDLVTCWHVPFLLISVAARAASRDQNGSNRLVRTDKTPAPVIHRAAWRYQPNPQELAIFRRITPLYLGSNRRGPQPRGSAQSLVVAGMAGAPRPSWP